MNARAPLLLIRADASADIGAGHVMRGLALAQAWQDAGGCVHFACASIPSLLADRLGTEHCKLTRLPVTAGSPADARATASLAAEHAAHWVVVDGYVFGAEYQQCIRDRYGPLLLIDDNGENRTYCADLVVNQNIHAHADMYGARASHTRLLLGCEYVMLRREFTAWRSWQRCHPPVATHLLISLGGADPGNATLQILQVLDEEVAPRLRLHVIVGGANPYIDVLRRCVAGSHHDIHLHCNVTDMPRELAGAHLAVSAAGSTTWEAAYLALPTVLVAVADNQRQIAQHFNQRGIFPCLGDASAWCPRQLFPILAPLLGDPVRRMAMGERARQLVDGDGVLRVLETMQDIHS